VDIRYRVPLPRTGTSSGPLALVALVSLGVGLLLIVVSRSLNQDATGG
jgi:LPXTG-motif cell wall-anchored protein